MFKDFYKNGTKVDIRLKTSCNEKPKECKILKKTCNDFL